MQAEDLAMLRDRVAALRAPPCGVAHEGIRAAPDRAPLRGSGSANGYVRVGICPEVVRATHLGCSHTMARYVLDAAIDALPDADVPALVAELHALEQAISILDHRRYDAETRHADALSAATGDVAGAALEIAALVAEHQAYVVRIAKLRDEVLRRLDDALSASRPDGERPIARGAG